MRVFAVIILLLLLSPLLFTLSTPALFCVHRILFQCTFSPAGLFIPLIQLLFHSANYPVTWLSVSFRSHLSGLGRHKEGPLGMLPPKYSLDVLQEGLGPRAAEQRSEEASGASGGARPPWG